MKVEVNLIDKKGERPFILVVIGDEEHIEFVEKEKFYMHVENEKCEIRSKNVSKIFEG